MKKKIIFVIPSLGRGGIEICFINMLKRMDTDKYEISVFNLSDQKELADQIPKGIKLLSLKEKEQPYFLPFSKSIKKLLAEKKILAMLKRIVKPILTKIFFKWNGEELLWSFFSKKITLLKEQYDVAIAYGEGRTTYFTCDKINSKVKFAWIHTDHQKAKYENSYNQKYYTKFDQLFFVSKDLKQKFIEKNPNLNEKCHVLYNIQEPEQIKQKAEEEWENCYKKESIHLISIGRVTKEKGYDYLIQIANRLKKQSISYKWYIVR